MDDVFLCRLFPDQLYGIFFFSICLSVLTSFADKGSFAYIEITVFAYFVKPLRININLTHTINLLQ